MDAEAATAKAPIPRSLLDAQEQTKSKRQSKNVKVSPGISLIAGGVAGAVEATVTVRLQEQAEGSNVRAKLTCRAVVSI